jgi:hypothetical protein
MQQIPHRFFTIYSSSIRSSILFEYTQSTIEVSVKNRDHGILPFIGILNKGYHLSEIKGISQAATNTSGAPVKQVWKIFCHRTA